MFGARRGPTLRMPTLLYFAGVPGAWNPGSRSKLTRAAETEAGAASIASETAIVTATLRIGSRNLYGAGVGRHPAAADRLDQCPVVALVRCRRTTRRSARARCRTVAVAEIGGDRHAVAGARVGAGQRRAAQLARSARSRRRRSSRSRPRASSPRAGVRRSRARPVDSLGPDPAEQEVAAACMSRWPSTTLRPWLRVAAAAEVGLRAPSAAPPSPGGRAGRRRRARASAPPRRACRRSRRPPPSGRCRRRGSSAPPGAGRGAATPRNRG